LRHTHQATARKSLERPLAEPAKTRHGPPPTGNDYLASLLYSLQVLTEAIVELADPHFVLGRM
jgi:hypothetical protein